MFCTGQSVTREDNVVFAYRYDQNVVQPALDGLAADIAGITLLQGDTGLPGDTGDTGLPGIQGNPGLPGIQGDTGLPGIQGNTGLPGNDGVDGGSPARVVWVADDGTGDVLLLSAALASITDASASNPYVVKIAPGVYTETSTVALKTYVAVEGSGQGFTTITCACGNDVFDATAATVTAGNIVAEIRHVTINNTGTASYSFGVYAAYVYDGSVSMNNVTVTATGGTSYNTGVYNVTSELSMNNVTATGTGGTYSYGVYNSSSSPSMNNVTATGTGGTYSYGVSNTSSSPSMNNVTATATGTFNRGVYNGNSSSASIRNSSITGGTNSIYNSADSSAQVADTLLDGPVDAGLGLTCTGVYTALFVALDTSCAPSP